MSVCDMSVCDMSVCDMNVCDMSVCDMLTVTPHRSTDFFSIFQVLDSLPNVKFEGLSDRLSRPSLSNVFNTDRPPNLADVHTAAKLPKPDLSKLSEHLTCLHAQFTSIKGNMKTG